MSFIKCSECGVSLNEDDVTCPECGAPVVGKSMNNTYDRKSLMFLVGGILLVVVFVLIVVLSNKIKQRNEEKALIGSWAYTKKSSANGGVSYEFYDFEEDGICKYSYGYRFQGEWLLPYSFDCTWTLSKGEVTLVYDDKNNTVEYLEFDKDNSVLFELDDDGNRENKFEKYD